MIGQSFLRATLIALLSTPLLAQSPCHVENDGNLYNNSVSMGGPNLLLAIKFTTPACFSASGAEIFTGEASGTNSLSIWTHNAGLNQPGVALTTGSWAMSAVNSWQGTSFAPTTLDCGGTYWIVWGCINGSQCSVDVPGTSLGQPYRGSFDGGFSWSGPFQFVDRHWKFRLLGNCSNGTAPFCFGDGSLLLPCPCANTGGTGRGCNNSANTTGALLSAAGTTVPDTLVLTSSDEIPQALTIFLQGDGCQPAGVLFGDGILCVSGNLKRLYVKSSSLAGSTTAPDFPGGDPSITTQSAILGDPISPGFVRYYQVYYRDPNPTFCPFPNGNTWNISGGLSAQW